LEDRAERIKKKSTIREYAEAAAIAILLALFIRAFVVQAFKIPSGSMEPTLLVGDHILVNKFLYGIKLPYFQNNPDPDQHPGRGDIIVFIYPEDKSKDFIKRVIGIRVTESKCRTSSSSSMASPLMTSTVIMMKKREIPADPLGWWLFRKIGIS